MAGEWSTFNAAVKVMESFYGTIIALVITIPSISQAILTFTVSRPPDATNPQKLGRDPGSARETRQ